MRLFSIWKEISILTIINDDNYDEMEDGSEDCELAERLPHEILEFYTVKLHGSFQSQDEETLNVRLEEGGRPVINERQKPFNRVALINRKGYLQSLC